MSRGYKIQRYRVALVRDGSFTAPLESVSSPEDAAFYFLRTLAGLPHEEVHALCLNARTK
jgi:hypothetical protein